MEEDAFYTNRNKEKNLYVVSNINHIEEDNPFHKRSFLIILGLVFTLLFFDVFFDRTFVKLEMRRRE